MRKKIFDPTIGIGDEVELIPGVPVKVVHQDEINEAADKGDMTFVCFSKIDMPEANIPNSRTVRCDVCDEECWMSPKTHSSWASCGAIIMCMKCVTKKLEKRKLEKENL